ncbi:MAG: hypothetical protein ACREMH_03880 [Gemmatimonadales bacterium]
MRLASTPLRIVGAILVFAGLLGLYAARVLFNSGHFADHVAASLDDRRVSGYVAGQLTNVLLEQRPGLTPVRPILLGTVETVVRSQPFRVIIQRATETAHASVVSGSAGQLVLSIPDFGAILQSAVSASPELAERIPTRLSGTVERLASLPLARGMSRVLRVARVSREAFAGVLLLGIVLSGLGVAASANHRHALLKTGEAWIVIAVILFALAGLPGRILGVMVGGAEGAATTGLWATFFGGLRPLAWVLATVGLACAAAVSSLQGTLDLGTIGAGARKWITQPPGSPLLRVVRAATLLVAGMAVVLAPGFASRLLVAVFGGLLAFLGLREIFNLALPQGGANEPTGRSLGGLAGGAAMRVAMTAAVIVPLGAAGLYFTARARERPPAPVVTSACNGLEELCRRRLDQVVFPGTHNSMAAASIVDWYMPNQERDIGSQLRDGIRALLVDATFGTPAGDKVQTLLGDDAATRKTYEEAVGKEGVAAALRIRDRLVPAKDAKPDLYMCHGFCELGSVKFSDGLEVVRDFLVGNPGEVILMVVQDEGVTAEQVAAAIEQAGLGAMVYRGPFTPPWPTLGELVTRNQRLFVTVEHDTGHPWVPNTYEVFQETPYAFPTPESMSCDPNRGAATNSLFLVNHFIEHVPPDPTAAAIVNARDFLFARAERCERQRRRVPNILAVDFYRTGDVVAVAAELNKAASASQSGAGRKE